jgi:hypothetical protein
MSYMFEVYYHMSGDSNCEENIIKHVVGFGGKLTYREASKKQTLEAICLTFEFNKKELAEKAASSLRSLGEHVEGPMDY